MGLFELKKKHAFKPYAAWVDPYKKNHSVYCSILEVEGWRAKTVAVAIYEASLLIISFLICGKEHQHKERILFETAMGQKKKLNFLDCIGRLYWSRPHPLLVKRNIWLTN